jgi:hypothetical protein
MTVMPKETDWGETASLNLAFIKNLRHLDVQKDNDFVPSFNLNLIT